MKKFDDKGFFFPVDDSLKKKFSSENNVLLAEQHIKRDIIAKDFLYFLSQNASTKL